MRLPATLRAVCWLGVGMSVSPASFALSECSVTFISNRLLIQMEEADEHSLRMSSRTDEFQARTHIVGDGIQRLSITSEMIADGQTRRVLSVFDGDKQWVEQRQGERIQVLYFRLEELPDESRPFDTGLYIWGTGLFSGEDYPGTVRALFSLYNFEASCTGSTATLRGAANPEAVTSYVDSRGGDPSSYRGFLDNFPHVRMTVDLAEDVITDYAFGKSDGELMFEVIVTDYRFGENLDEDVFRYSPPDLVEPVDVTNQL